jgi:hypothetical protein
VLYIGSFILAILRGYDDPTRVRGELAPWLVDNGPTGVGLWPAHGVGSFNGFSSELV